MKIRLWILLAALLAFPSICETLEAAPILIINSDGILTGARYVTVHRAYGRGDELWDVDFVDGTCAQVFGVCSTAKFPFHQFDGESAIAALKLLFVDSALGLFDSFPNLTLGCTGENVTICGIITPDAVIPSGGGFMEEGTFVNDLGVCTRVPPFCPATFPATAVNGLTLRTTDLTDYPNYVWAVWTPSAVPESAPLGTLSIALVALIAVGYRRGTMPRRKNA